MPSDRYREKALRALPVLVDCAQRRQTISYKELGEKIDVYCRNVGRVLAHIRDDICQPRCLPLITAIVVTHATRLPGGSFLPEGTKHLTKKQYRLRFQDLRDQVFAHENWDQLLAELGVKPVRKTAEDIDQEGREYLDYEARRGGTGESPEHERLKQFVSSHPEVVKLPATAKPSLEKQLLSGDRCDVVFHGDERAAVVEVKCRHRGELVKGIYQAIKYRALVRAEEGQGDDYPVDAFLVAYAIPDDIEEHAQHFGVRCIAVDEGRISEGG